MSDIRVKSWLDLQEQLFDTSWQPAISRFRSNFVYRGVPRVTHTLDTSLQTAGLEAHEQKLLTSFRKYALRSAVHGDWVWNWLSLAKHHGLPTRLLDWSYSPYVALHFATVDFRHADEDGAVWCVDYHRTNELLPAEGSSEHSNLPVARVYPKYITLLQPVVSPDLQPAARVVGKRDVA